MNKRLRANVKQFSGSALKKMARRLHFRVSEGKEENMDEETVPRAGIQKVESDVTVIFRFGS